MDIKKLHERIAETEALREGWEALQDSLTHQGQLLHYLTEFAPAAVAMLDTQLHYVLVSLRWKQFFQLEDRTLIELPFADSFEDKPKLLSIHLRLGLKGEVSVCPEFEFKRPDGSTDWISWTVHPWYNARGEVGGVVVGVEVISAQKRLALSLEELNRDLERKVAQRTRSLREVNEELRGFAHNVSHDLRTPLVNITGFVQEINWGLHELKKSLANQPLSQQTEKLLHEELPEALHYIEQAGIQMDRLLESLRRLSSMGQFNLEISQVDVNEVWKRVCDSQAHSIQEKQILVESASLPVIRTDYLALSQILTNLLSNSIKYADPERQCRVSLRAEEQENQYEFFWQDNGIGIPENKLEFIFHPFTRLNGKDQAEGEGMGLAFVKTLVRKLNGEISCARNEDHGVTFRLVLPK